jgi:hypothetical protein
LAEQYRKTLGDDLTKQLGTEKRPAAKMDWGRSPEGGYPTLICWVGFETVTSFLGRWRWRIPFS